MAAMDFTSATEGVSFTGMETFKDTIHTDVFDAMVSAINNLDTVRDAVDNNWVGNSANNFKSNITNGAKTMADQMKDIQAMLDTELDGIVQSVAEADDTLIELEQ